MEIATSGMPTEWQARLTEFWWLDEYCLINSGHVRLPNVFTYLQYSPRVRKSIGIRDNRPK
jgi:hypothetical protein